MIYRDNPYRTLGLGAEADRRAIHDAWQRGAAASDTAGPMPDPLAFLGEPVRTDVSMRDAAVQLATVQGRLLARVLWFTAATGLDRRALERAAAGDVAAAAALWGASDEIDHRANRARLVHAVTLARDVWAAPVTAHVVLPDAAACSRLAALTDWAQLLDSEEFWARFTELERKSGFGSVADDRQLWRARSDAHVLLMEPYRAHLRKLGVEMVGIINTAVYGEARVGASAEADREAAVLWSMELAHAGEGERVADAIRGLALPSLWKLVPVLIRSGFGDAVAARLANPVVLDDPRLEAITREVNAFADDVDASGIAYVEYDWEDLPAAAYDPLLEWLSAQVAEVQRMIEPVCASMTSAGAAAAFERFIEPYYRTLVAGICARFTDDSFLMFSIRQAIGLQSANALYAVAIAARDHHLVVHARTWLLEAGARALHTDLAHRIEAELARTDPGGAPAAAGAGRAQGSSWQARPSGRGTLPGCEMWLLVGFMAAMVLVIVIDFAGKGRSHRDQPVGEAWPSPMSVSTAELEAQADSARKREWLDLNMIELTSTSWKPAYRALMQPVLARLRAVRERFDSRCDGLDTFPRATAAMIEGDSSGVRHASRRPARAEREMVDRWRERIDELRMTSDTLDTAIAAVRSVMHSGGGSILDRLERAPYFDRCIVRREDELFAYERYLGLRR